MAYLGDFTLGDTLDFKFSTVGTTGAPTTLAGTPAISAYVGNSTTQITAGITLTVDFDAVTGLHNVRVVASAGNGYAAQTNVDLVITAGTVGGTSVVGYVVGSFSIENRSTQLLATAANLATVDAAVDAIKVVTDALPNAGALTSLATAAALATVDSVVDAILVDTAEIGVAGAGLTALATQASVNTIDDFLDTEVAAIKAKTDNLPAAPAATGDIPTATQNADALLNRDMSAVSDTNARSPLNALRFLRNKWDISGTSLTVKKEDDSTTAWSATVTAAPGADPISGNDPT
jgi:hypothetical protein